MSYDFGKFKKKTEPSKTTIIKKAPITQSSKKRKEIVTSFTPKISHLHENTDLEILSILAKKYKAKGTNVIRHNQKNPFVQDLARLSYLIQNIETFQFMHDKGLIGKTKYSGQWKIL